MWFRFEVESFQDVTSQKWLRKIEVVLPAIRQKITSIQHRDIYWVETVAPPAVEQMREVLEDPVLQKLHVSTSGDRKADFFIERKFKAGVTDNVARSFKEALQIVGVSAEQCSSGGLLVLSGSLTPAEVQTIAREVFSNHLIEDSFVGSELDAARFKNTVGSVVELHTQPHVEKIDLNGLTTSQLVAMSTERLWALSADEMVAIQKHFASRRFITDVEIEVLAQTWSEHCKHKIFGATIDYSSPQGRQTIKSLFKTTISGTTRALPRPWLLSVFDDNAGVVAFDDEHAFCVKVETHNSPSALDPFGGALTGIVGVNRDILGCGLGAKPIANTNVFCLAAPDYDDELPLRLLHPRRILDGVTRGIEAGGNQSGVPTINGAFAFDDRYMAKPLVYCGTIGWMPRVIAGRDACLKEIKPGDRVVMVGGRIGKDGIHGATFSSLALDEKSPVTAVQLGDPITQKRMMDFILEARDLGLYRAITDNGAGGLSSSVGEMARLCGGADIDVSKAKTKYLGLQPYELTVSESQERMTLAVPEKDLPQFIALADRRGVEVSDLGQFNESQRFTVRYQEEIVADLDLEFLHGGCPTLNLRAEWTRDDQANSESESERIEVVETSIPGSQLGDLLMRLLRTPDIASKEWLIRQYDHGVQGQSVVKPLSRKNSHVGPNDSGVILPKVNSRMGLVVGCGLQPWLSDLDAGLMAEAAVDEAIRNVIAGGAEFGDPTKVISLVDNFCWPDPVSNTRFAADLVRACLQMQKMALTYEIPLISGKDSMKNDYRGKFKTRDVQISVPPTLLMTAVARVPDISTIRTADFKKAGDVVVWVGQKEADLGLRVSALSRMLRQLYRTVQKSQMETAKKLYTWIAGEGRAQFESIHDLSEGGLLVALSESCFLRNLGVKVELSLSLMKAFGEGMHGFVMSFNAHFDFRAEFKRLGISFEVLGIVTEEAVIRLNGAQIKVSDLNRAWKREGYWQ